MRFMAHFPSSLPKPRPPKHRSQSEIYLFGLDSSPSPTLYQKVSKLTPQPIFSRFTNKKPVLSVQSGLRGLSRTNSSISRATGPGHKAEARQTKMRPRMYKIKACVCCILMCAHISKTKHVCICVHI